MTTKKRRTKHTAEFKSEALKIAEIKGVSESAKELKLYTTQLYNWRKAAQKLSSTSYREAELAAEVAKLKRQLAEQTEDLAILKKAATYFAKNQK
jgi:transposase